MSGLAQGIANRGAEIIVDKEIRGGRTVVFKGDAPTLGALSLGNRDAWKQLIADNDPKDGSAIYIRLTVRNTGNGEIHVMTPAQAARHLSNV